MRLKMKAMTPVARNFGEINLWLQNGASWTNEAWGEPPDAYFGEDFRKAI